MSASYVGQNTLRIYNENEKCNNELFVRPHRVSISPSCLRFEYFRRFIKLESAVTAAARRRGAAAIAPCQSQCIGQAWARC